MIFGRATYKAHAGKAHAYILVTGPDTPPRCACGKVEDPTASRRGRNNRKRGGRAELDIARTYGGQKVGPLGLPEDIRGKSWSTQVKVSQRAAPTMWTTEFGKLDGATDGRTPRLILRYTRPSVGSEDFVVVRGADWLAWFGRDE